MLQAVLQHAKCNHVILHEEPLNVPLLTDNLLVDPLANLASLSCCWVFLISKRMLGRCDKSEEKTAMEMCSHLLTEYQNRALRGQLEEARSFKVLKECFLG